MKKRHLIISLIIFSYTQLISNTEPTPVTSKITEVVVYTDGALVSRELSNGNLIGTAELLIKNLPKTLTPSTIVIDAEESLEISSINNSLKAIPSKADKFMDSLTVSTTILQDSLARLTRLYEVLKIERKLLEEHKNYADENGRSDINAVIKASAFYRTRLKEILLEQLALEQHIKEKQSNIDSNMVASRNYSNQQTKFETQIRIKLNAKKANGKITLKYYVPNAKWYTYYDIKVNRLDEPMQILRKAYVSQMTGEDWDNVKLTLSNANPTESNFLPPINPYRIDGPRVNSNIIQKANGLKNFNSVFEVYGLVVDNTGLPLIGANVMISGTNQGTLTDINGQFHLNTAANKLILISYTGYQSQQVLMKPGPNIIRLADSAVLDEIAVTNLGSRAQSTFYYVDGIRVSSESAERMVINQVKIDAISSVEYHITDPYSINSDNKEIDVLLEKNKVSCDFVYKSNPSKSEKAFLTAKIPDWYKLDFLAGHANLFLSNTYKGKTYIDPDTEQDTLSISLGYDPEIIIKRTQVKDLYAKKILSKNVQEKLTYEIVVKNNKSYPIALDIKDQIPVSNNKEIKIELLDFQDGTIDKEKGILNWNINLQSGQGSKRRFSYKVKYPKSYKIML